MTTATESHAAAVLAALNAVLGAMSTPRRAYDLDELAKLTTKPDDYVEITVSRRAGAESRACGRTDRGGFRVTTRAVSTSTTGGRVLLDKCKQALEFQSLTVGGLQSTRIQFESSDDVLPDDGAWSGYMRWTYAI